MLREKALAKVVPSRHARPIAAFRQANSRFSSLNLEMPASARPSESTGRWLRTHMRGRMATAQKRQTEQFR